MCTPYSVHSHMLEVNPLSKERTPPTARISTDNNHLFAGRRGELSPPGSSLGDSPKYWWLAAELRAWRSGVVNDWR